MTSEIREKVRNYLCQTFRRNTGEGYAALFSLIFDRIFGVKKANRPNIYRSAIASLTLILFISGIWSIAEPDRAQETFSVMSEDLLSTVVILLLSSTLINFAGDYFSIWETRIVIGLMACSGAKTTQSSIFNSRSRSNSSNLFRRIHIIHICSRNLFRKKPDWYTPVLRSNVSNTNAKWRDIFFIRGPHVRHSFDLFRHNPLYIGLVVDLSLGIHVVANISVDTEHT